MLWILQYDPEKRPSLSQIRNHPWMQKPYNYEATRQKMLRHLSVTKISEPVNDKPKEASPMKTT